jgi:hypothetical protein
MEERKNFFSILHPLSSIFGFLCVSVALWLKIRSYLAYSWIFSKKSCSSEGRGLVKETSAPELG